MALTLQDRRHNSRSLLTILIALLVTAPSLWAQSNYGAIRGIISDAQGAVLPKS